MFPTTAFKHTFQLLLAAVALSAPAQTFKPLKYGNMDSWVTRHIHESGIIGGNTKTIYEVGPSAVIDGNKAYTPMGGSPWATSNVYAKVHGVVKGSNAVYPDDRAGHGRCAKLCSQMESVKVLGIVNMDVMVAGSMFLGRMLEPITSTSSPYSKFDMGMPYTGRPQALRLDYKLTVPPGNSRVKSTGFGRKKTIAGRDHAVVFVLLQRRWEDADGNIHARRVATGSQRFSSSTPSWVSAHDIKLVYGDASAKTGFDGELGGLRQGGRSYYAVNSRGKVVKIDEEGWDEPGATPTHAIVMISSGCSEPYVATPGMTFWVDNIGFVE